MFNFVSWCVRPITQFGILHYPLLAKHVFTNKVNYIVWYKTTMPPMVYSVQKVRVERTEKEDIHVLSLHTSPHTMNRILGSVLLGRTKLLENGRQLTSQQQTEPPVIIPL